jgi:hypothetical protein
MKNDYKSLQKEIEKLLWETSAKKTGKTYHEMESDERYQLTVKKIGELVMQLEIIEEEERKSYKGKTKINT